MTPFFLSILLAASAQPQDAGAPTTPTEEPAAETPAEAPDPDPEVCRTRLIQSYAVGERFRRVRTCKLRSEWAEGNRAGRR